MIRISSLKLAIDHTDDELKSTILKSLRISETDLVSYRILKRSIDARRNRPLQKVYSVLVKVNNPDSLAALIRKASNLSLMEEQAYHTPSLNRNINIMGERPLVVGTGPAGIFAGLILAEAGLKPILLERGKQVKERTRDVTGFWQNRILNLESNVQYGEGGAGTFSDGKLRTRVKDKSQRTHKILKEMVLAGAPEDILFDFKPHVGTANLVKVVKNLRLKIDSFGGEYHFESKVIELLKDGNRIKGVKLENGEVLFSRFVVLAIGHSARDTFQMLHEIGIQMAPKPFSVGFRIEHPQNLINRIQYGEFAEHPGLGAADYQLAFRTSTGRSVYSFCMCPGGTVIGSSSEADTVVTNGMSQYNRAQINANSAIVAEVFPEDYGQYASDGFNFQRLWERNAFKIGGSDYDAPVQLVGDFLTGKTTKGLQGIEPSYKPGYKMTDLSEALPISIIQSIKEALPEFDKRMPGFARHDAVLTGVETRTSSPLRILRDENFQSVSLGGLYPVGEGSGYAGGIMSSAIDGIKAAEKIIQYANEKLD